MKKYIYKININQKNEVTILIADKLALRQISKHKDHYIIKVST